MAQPQSQAPQAHHQSIQQMQQQMQMQQMQQMQQQMQQRPPFPQAQHAPAAPNLQQQQLQQQQQQLQQQQQQQPGFAMPPNKRPRMSPTSPPPVTQPSYAATPYATTPQMQSSTPAPTASPATYTNLAPPPSQYMSYTNGASPAQSPAPTHAPSPAQPPTQLPVQAPANPTSAAPSATPSAAPSPAPLLSLPETRPVQTPTPTPLSLPSTAPPPTSQPFATAVMTPIGPPPQSTPGPMAPPSKPPARDTPVKEIEYDIQDSLAGTNIDLRAEEQFLSDFYAGSFTEDTRTGFPANAPGGRGSFYGAGLANQPGEATEMSQEAYEAELARRAWDEAARRLAISRLNELNDPFLSIANLHHRMDKIAKEFGLSLNHDLKNANPLGKLRPAQEVAPPKVTVSTQPGPDGTMVVTTGSFLPHDAYLVDQLALLSLATRHRLRELLEDADLVARHRQTTSHGEIPAEWADVAVPLRTGLDSLPDDTVNGISRKRSYDDYSSGQAMQKGAKHGPRNLMEAVREHARLDRDIEEARLRKRQKRLNPEPAKDSSRAGSAAPSAPKDGAAPETEPAPTKAPTKKELKKSAKLAEASSIASTNQTLSTVMGGFGRKKRKEYTWMQKATTSTPSTPKASGSSAGGGDSGSGAGGDGGANKAPEKTTLTADPRYPRLGTWREDKEKGKNIQLRDWLVALEMDGIEIRAIQDAYLRLDSSLPRDRS